MRDIILGEFFGTMLLILLGDGVVANVLLNKSGQQGAGPVQITFAWGLAVMIPACIFGALTGAHFNPALSIALAFNGGIEWNTVPSYIIGQMLGAFCGAILVYILFKDHYDATSDDPLTVRATFCTAPTIPNTFRNLLSEIIGTFVYFVMFLVVRVEPKDRRPRDCMVFNRILKYSFADGNAREGTYRLDRPAACRRLFSGGFVALLRPVRRPVRCRPGSIFDRGIHR